tara:strand:+ start:171 stop:296 length:126 start_codon:yes stop_codon:yes gene_type:complete
MTEQEKKHYEEIALEFWMQIEKEAEKLELPIDYYLEEFFCS